MKRFCVTVMDNWTPTRTFWTFGGALRYAVKHLSAAHLFVWNSNVKAWDEIDRIWICGSRITDEQR